MVDDLRPPYRVQFDNARDPYSARNALGITDAVSGAASSADFPADAWTAWSPAITSSSGTITSATINRARYIKLGKTVTANLDLTITNAGSGAGTLLFSLPVICSASGGGVVCGREFGVAGFLVACQIDPASTVGGIVAYNGTTAIGTGARFGVNAVYEVD
jgi:hypothetical protein